MFVFALVFVYLSYSNVIFDILESSTFRKYSTCWVFSALLSLSLSLSLYLSSLLISISIVEIKCEWKVDDEDGWFSVIVFPPPIQCTLPQ